MVVRRRGSIYLLDDDPNGANNNNPNSTPRDAVHSIVTPRAARRNIFLAFAAAGLLFRLICLNTIATDETVRLHEHGLKEDKMKTKELLRNTSTLKWYMKPQPILAEFPPIERRLEFIDHLEKLPSFKTGIQVGIQGMLAENSIDIWKSCSEYVLVYGYPIESSADTKAVSLNETQERMKPWVAKGIVEFFLLSSTDASKHLLDNHYDYVYLDARHDYASVKEDVEHYWPKLRPGGILGGHNAQKAQYAIKEFCMQQGGLQVYTSDENFPSWYIQKPY